MTADEIFIGETGVDEMTRWQSGHTLLSCLNPTLMFNKPASDF